MKRGKSDGVRPSWIAYRMLARTYQIPVMQATAAVYRILAVG